jgi:hypothetical protein
LTGVSGGFIFIFILVKKTQDNRELGVQHVQHVVKRHDSHGRSG